MKAIITKIATYTLSLFISTLLFSGINVSGGLTNYAIAGSLLAILSTILDPLIKVVTLPFNILTLGLLSFLTTLVALFITSLFFSNLTIQAFTFSGISFLGLTIGQIQLSRLLSFILISATIYFLNKLVAFIFNTK